MKITFVGTSHGVPAAYRFCSCYMIESSGSIYMVDAGAPATGVVYEDENIRAEYIPTKHMPNSYAVLITEGEKRVLFGGDLSHGLRRCDVPEVIKEEIDGFVCEMAHFGMAELAPFLEDCRAKKVVFSHVYPLNKYDDIEAIMGKYGFEVLTPCDGDVIEV